MGLGELAKELFVIKKHLGAMPDGMTFHEGGMHTFYLLFKRWIRDYEKLYPPNEP